MDAEGLVLGTSEISFTSLDNQLTHIQAGSIITTRIMQIILLKAFDVHPAHYAMPCCKVDSMLHDRTLTVYPECASFYSGENLQQNAVVRPSLINPTSAAEAAAALDSTFGMASFLAFFLHSIGLELYVSTYLPVCSCLFTNRLSVVECIK